MDVMDNYLNAVDKLRWHFNCPDYVIDEEIITDFRGKYWYHTDVYVRYADTLEDLVDYKKGNFYEMEIKNRYIYEAEDYTAMYCNIINREWCVAIFDNKLEVNSEGGEVIAFVPFKR